MVFYRLGLDCSNCGANTWHKDLIVELRTNGKRVRFSCIYCGHDIWPGGTNRPTRQQEIENENWIRRNNMKWVEDQIGVDRENEVA